MAEKPEERARAEIDRLLAAAGWSVQSISEANIHASHGVAIREFPLKTGHGFADYLLYIDAKVAGTIEAKKEGVTLTGVEPQSDRYAQGLPDALPAWNRPLPFSYCWRAESITYPELAAFAGLSMSEVHGALKRAEQARLLFFDAKRPTIIKPAFKEFLFHGARYAFPPARGTMVGGIPTAYAAAPLKSLIAPSADPPPVWPYAQGSERGIALIPLYPSAPAAALRNATLYENLALFDALRSGNARERTLAQKLFEERL